MLRFAGFELNQQRAELRGPDGEAIRLRPKPFAMLHVLASNGPVAAAVAGLCAVIGVAAATPIFAPDLIFGSKPPVIAVMPIADASNDSQAALMAANVTDRLTDGLAGIDNIRVVAPHSDASLQRASARSAPADFVVNGELQRGAQAWTVQARMTDVATGEVKWTTSLSVVTGDTDVAFQQSRLTGGLGHSPALRINTLLHPGAPSGGAKVVIEQATDSITQTSRERFAAAQTMLEKALVDEPNNADLQVAQAALQLRGIQMVWYSPADRAAAESNARSMLERALRVTPNSIPVLEAYCRFLNATNHFVDSLVACARALSFDPWNGLVLYHLGLAQIQLGRFEEALATFKQADRFDTPEVSRWTWLIGAGWANLLIDRPEEAVPWLQRSIAITPASGRTHMLLAVAYQRLGRPDEAKAAMAKGMALRPDSTVSNVKLPTLNASPAYLEKSQRMMATMVEIGLPER